MNMNKKVKLFSSCVMTFLSLSAIAQNSGIRGTIMDNNNTVLSGATVTIKELQQSAKTDAQGNFSFSALKPGNYTITVTYLGFNPSDQLINLSSTGTTTVNFHLISDQNNLEEVVVIGYGTQKKGELTGSISTVSSKDFQKGAIQSADQLIVGKAPGVQITSNGGQPGSGSTIRIRAGASLNATNDPLYVIDGIPMSGSSISGAANPLSLLNPNDIETCTI